MPCQKYTRTTYATDDVLLIRSGTRPISPEWATTGFLWDISQHAIDTASRFPYFFPFFCWKGYPARNSPVTDLFWSNSHRRMEKIRNNGESFTKFHEVLTSFGYKTVLSGASPQTPHHMVMVK